MGLRQGRIFLQWLVEIRRNNEDKDKDNGKEKDRDEDFCKDRDKDREYLC